MNTEEREAGSERNAEAAVDARQHRGDKGRRTVHARTQEVRGQHII